MEASTLISLILTAMMGMALISKAHNQRQKRQKVRIKVNKK